MAKLTKREIRQHRAFLQRQNRYEKKWAKIFFRYFNKVYKTAAHIIENEGVESYLSKILQYQNENELQSIYRKLYDEVTINEAIIEKRLLMGLESTQKDIIDDLIQAFPYKGGADIQIFRQLLKEYLIVRIGTRITQVTASTVKFISEAIQQGINEGLGALQIARLIREKTDFNRNRSLMVARTETVTGSNQGKYMSALSSDLVYEKRWIPTNQPGRTRETHLAMLNTPFIDMDAPFLVPGPKGGFETARYPGDESLSAANTVNCRCSIGFRVKRDAEGNPIRRIF